MKTIFLILVAIVVCGCSETLTTKTCTSNVHCASTEYCQMTQSSLPESRNVRQGYCVTDK
jgi:hypothetical protein